MTAVKDAMDGIFLDREKYLYLTMQYTGVYSIYAIEIVDDNANKRLRFGQCEQLS